MSSVVTPDNIQNLDSLDLRIAEVKDHFYALGNLVLANDFGAVVSPLIDSKTSKQIEDTLDVEVNKTRIANSDLVGSLAFTTNLGVLVTPFASDEEIDELKSLLKVEKGNIGTINLGQPFIAAGILANTRGCVVGNDTTGLETVRISQTLMSE